MPKPGNQSWLTGLACASANSCWAVGTYGNSKEAELNEVLHWNGSRWSKASVPTPGGTSQLYGAACASLRSCWAVGQYTNGNGAQVNEALHWNGVRWSKASVPSPSGTASGDRSILNAVRCTSPDNCWAVGDYTDSQGAQLNQALHWNGRKWHLAATPQPAGTANGDFSGLNSVNCASSADCWAVGIYTSSVAFLNQALHWDGRKWSTAVTPEPGGAGTGASNTLEGVACASATDCWAVGTYINASGAYVGQTLHWGGRKWSLVNSPDPDGTGQAADNRLHGVACVSSADCWAVGSYGSQLNLALHWNGKKWFLVATPDAAGTANGTRNELWSVRCTSRGSCQAVGESRVKVGTPIVNQALHWNGSKWSLK